MNANPHSVAAACANIVFPQPGGPYKRIARGILIGDSWKSLRKTTGSWKTSVIATLAEWRPPMSSQDTGNEVEEEVEVRHQFYFHFNLLCSLRNFDVWITTQLILQFYQGAGIVFIHMYSIFIIQTNVFFVNFFYQLWILFISISKNRKFVSYHEK